MSDQPNQPNGGTTRVLHERVKVLGGRVDKVEAEAKDREQVLNTLLTELRVLQARVGWFACAIGSATGLAASILVKVLS